LLVGAFAGTSTLAAASDPPVGNLQRPHDDALASASRLANRAGRCSDQARRDRDQPPGSRFGLLRPDRHLPLVRFTSRDGNKRTSPSRHALSSNAVTTLRRCGFAALSSFSHRPPRQTASRAASPSPAWSPVCAPRVR